MKRRDGCLDSVHSPGSQHRQRKGNGLCRSVKSSPTFVTEPSNSVRSGPETITSEARGIANSIRAPGQRAGRQAATQKVNDKDQDSHSAKHHYRQGRGASRVAFVLHRENLHADGLVTG